PYPTAIARPERSQYGTDSRGCRQHRIVGSESKSERDSFSTPDAEGGSTVYTPGQPDACRSDASRSVRFSSGGFINKEKLMGNRFKQAALTVAVGVLCATTGFAQPPGPGRGGPGGPGGPGGAAPATGNVAVANPTYTSLV